MSNSKAKIKEFVENSENSINTQETNSEPTQETQKVDEISQDEIFLNLVLDCSERYLPLASKIGHFLSEKFLAEVDRSFVNSTLQTVKANSLIDSESLINSAKERLKTIDAINYQKQKLIGVGNAVSS